MRILIVDDEKNIRTTLLHSLSGCQHETETAITGEEALEKITQQFYDLLILDLKLPGIGGLELIRVIRQKSPDSKIVVISAHATVEMAVEAMKMGVVDFIEKPFTPDLIRNVVKNQLE